MLISGWRSLLCCHVFLLFSSSLTIRMWHALYMFIWDYCMKRNSKIIVWDLAYKFFREEDDAHKTYTYHWGHPLIYHIGASAVVSNPSKNNVRSFWFKDFSRGRDGASELTILETSRRNFAHHPHDGGNISITKNNPPYENITWVLVLDFESSADSAENLQLKYSYGVLLVEPAAFLRCRSSATGYEYRFALLSLQMSFVQGESILQAVPQIADIILTYHNSNLLVIARRLPSYASLVAFGSRFFVARVKFVRARRNKRAARQFRFFHVGTVLYRFL